MQLGFICHRVQEWRLGYNVKLQQSSKEIWLEPNKRFEGDIEKKGGVEVGLLWGVVEIIADIFREVVLTIMNLLFLTSQW